MISFDLQKLIYNTLKTLPYKVYDYVPKNTKCPYIKIGASHGGDDSTKIDLGFKDYQYIDVFSDYEGQKEVKQIMQQVNDLLQNEILEVTGDKQAFLYLDESKIIKQSGANGDYNHGILIYKILTKG